MLERAVLCEEHRELIELAGGLARAVASDVPCVEAVATLRWRMRRKLVAHLVKEDQMLYPRLRASADPAVADCAGRFADEMGGLAADYQAYMADWTADRMTRDWAGFRADTAAVLAALGRRVEREETELYPLMDAHRATPEARAAVRP